MPQTGPWVPVPNDSSSPWQPVDTTTASPEGPIPLTASGAIAPLAPGAPGAWANGRAPRTPLRVSAPPPPSSIQPPPSGEAAAGMLGLSPGVAFAEQAMGKGLGGAAKEDLATAWAHRPSAHTVIPAVASTAALLTPGLEPEGVAGWLGLGASLPARMAASGLTQGTAAGLSDLAAYVWDRLHGRTQAPVSSELPHAAETGVLGGVVGAGLEPLTGGWLARGAHATPDVVDVLGENRIAPQVVEPGLTGSLVRLAQNIGRGSFIRGEKTAAEEGAQVAGMPQRVAGVMQRIFGTSNAADAAATPAAMQGTQGQLIDNLEQALAAPRAEYDRLIQQGLPADLQEEQRQLTQAIAARTQNLAKLGLTPADDPTIQAAQQRLNTLNDAANLSDLQRRLSGQLNRSRDLAQAPVTDTGAKAGVRSALDTAQDLRSRIYNALDTLNASNSAEYRNAAKAYRAAFQRYGNEVVEHVLNQQPDQLADWLLNPRAQINLSREGGPRGSLTLSRADIIRRLKGALSPQQFQDLQGTLATHLFTNNINIPKGTINIDNVLQALNPTDPSGGGIDKDLAQSLFGQHWDQVQNLATGMRRAIKYSGEGTVFIALEQMAAIGALGAAGVEALRGNPSAAGSAAAYGGAMLALPYVMGSLLASPKLTNYFVDAINAPTAQARQRLITRVATMPLFQAALGKVMAPKAGETAQVSTQPGGNLLHAGRLTPPPPHP